MSQRQSEETPANPNGNGGAQTTQLSTSPSSQQRSSSPASTCSTNKGRGDDYVYFERSTDGFSSDAVSRATAAKLKLESYYKLAVDSAIERNARCASQAACLFTQSTLTAATFVDERNSSTDSIRRRYPMRRGNAKFANIASWSRSIYGCVGQRFV